MGENFVAFLPLLDCLANRTYDPGRRDAKRHRRFAADVPLASANELVPVADPRRSHVDQDLILREWTGSREINRLDRAAQTVDAGYLHTHLPTVSGGEEQLGGPRIGCGRCLPTARSLPARPTRRSPPATV